MLFRSRTGIALALISPQYVVGEKVLIDVRGRISELEIVKVPLVPSRVK